MTALLALAACSRAPASDPRMVTEWMRTLYGAIRAERLSPPVAARLMVYASAALDAGLGASGSGQPALTGILNGFPDLPTAESKRAIDPDLTAIAAERVVLDSLLQEGLPTTRAAVSQLADSLAEARVALGIDEEVQANSRDLGRRLGMAIVHWSRGDGFDSTRGRTHQGPKGLAYWVNDAPATVYATQSTSGASELVSLSNPANVMQSSNSSDRGLILSRPKKPGVGIPAVNMAGMSEPFWGTLRPFALKSWNECPAPAPVSYAEDTASDLYREASEVLKMRSQLTPEQKTIAYYWADNAGESGTPVGHWVSIAAQIAAAQKLSAAATARLALATSVAQADAFISTWGYKYQFALLRPRTYIRRVLDTLWEPLIPTPPFPEYPSGHSATSAASAEVLTAFFGDTVAFQDSTGLSIGSAVRSFPSFRAAAHEAGLSRIYGGIHFSYGNLGGRTVGECVGAKAVERLKVGQTK
ncbi:MAG TPA: vanadium-dependent haloperoxidase [Gemmatimonadaceae bacterium]|nr:vanadium-dependent haloperoxidase [Gemmatimonadaceae bacterium]